MLDVKGNFEKVKKEMKSEIKKCTDQVKYLKKAYKDEFKKDKKYPSKVQIAINELDAKKAFLSPSKILPVKIQGIVINHKLYLDFLKKLNGFETSLVVLDSMVVLNYWKPGQFHQSKGSLALYDIGKYFEGFNHIPDAVIVDG